MLHQASIFQAKIDDCNDNSTRHQGLIMELEKNLNGFKEEMVHFRENEHYKLVERLTSLEKKFTQMKSKAGSVEKEVSNQGASRLNEEDADMMHDKVSNLELLI